MPDPVPHRVRFGGFELDLQSGELCSIGTENPDNKILLREQAFQVLRLLIESRGKIVAREEIRKRLWPNDTIVDFDHSINAAVKTLRRALGDSADNPQYIETLARRGYRLRVATEWLETKIDTPSREIAIPQSFPGLAGLTGKNVLHYRVIELIGGGGMGKVYKAEDLKLARLVALKFLPEEFAADPVALQRFEREAQSASTLNHSNICTIHQIEEYEGQPFIVMELLEGQSLLERLTASEANAVHLAPLLEIAIQICAGLQAAHDKGIIHRDIKPANIFVTSQGTVKILDFGLAKLAEREEMVEDLAERPARASSANTSASPTGRSAAAREEFAGGLTRAGIVIGTAAYMSPEQIRREPLDARSDLFSCGLVLYEMATGRRGFSGETEDELHDAILNQTLRPARDLNSAVPRSLDAIIARSLEKDRSQRYQSAAELRTDLERAQKEMHPSRRRAGKWLACVLLLLLATGAWLYWDYRKRVTLSATDTIVVAEVSNHTGDPVLDDAVNSALRVELEQTPYLNVLRSDKLLGTLQLLGLHYDAKVTPEVARQVCMRTNSKMILGSSIADDGNRFQIELSAIGCQSGSTIVRVRQSSGTRNDIVHELGVAAVRLRRKLGEPATSIQQFNQPLEEATTSSPEALRLVTQGYRRHLVNDPKGAKDFYQRAIDVDPNFALAYSALGAAHENLGEFDSAATAEKKTYDLRNRMTLPGRFQAQTGYYDLVTGQMEKSLVIYEQWLELFPQNVIARVNFITCLHQMGRADRALLVAHEATRLYPVANYYPLMREYITLNRFDEAKATFDESLANRKDGISLRAQRLLLAFLQKDNAAIEEQWNWARGKPDAEDTIAFGRYKVETYYGRLREAGRWKKRFRARPENSGNFEPAYRAGEEALDHAEVGDLAQSQRQAASALALPQDRHARLGLALALARAGDLARAQALTDALTQELPLDTLAQNYSLPTIRAAIQIYANNPAGAVGALRPTADYELAEPEGFNSLYPAYMRGLAYIQMGDGNKAAAEFQKLLDHSGFVGRDVIGSLSHLQMARAQKLTGNAAAARKWYQDFLTLWKDADPDIPIYRQAKVEYARLLSSARWMEPPTSMTGSSKR